LAKEMKAKLISYSQTDPSDPILNAALNQQELIAYCARVSNPSNQQNNQVSDKLLQYLIKHKHWSPFEMVSVCMEIETTRDIVRQLLRHRSFSFQEYSQRYADPTQDLDFVLRDARLQDPKNRQNSIETNDVWLKLQWEKAQQRVLIAAREAYKWAIDNGIAKEQARSVLPEGLTVSRLLVNGTLRSWIHYIELRSGNGTQLEHIEIAIECAKAIAKIFPMVDNFVQKNS
jgi:thymidylate synthase (FAD)